MCGNTRGELCKCLGHYHKVILMRHQKWTLCLASSGHWLGLWCAMDSHSPAPGSQFVFHFWPNNFHGQPAFLFVLGSFLLVQSIDTFYILKPSILSIFISIVLPSLLRINMKGCISSNGSPSTFSHLNSPLRIYRCSLSYSLCSSRIFFIFARPTWHN